MGGSRFTIKMGSAVSIHNDTEVKLNIALSQVGPLYYKNCIQPGECFTFDVGKVWFTVDGRVWNGENDYTGSEVASAIIDCTLQAVTLFMILFNGRLAIGTGNVTEAAAGHCIGTYTRMMSTAKSAYESDITKKLLLRLFDGNAIHSPGWYFGNDRHISISGGPKYVSGGINDMLHEIDLATINNPFVIEDRSPQ